MKNRIANLGVKLNRTDKIALSAFKPVLAGIAQIFGSNCEVVLHSLEDMSHSIINIVNGHVTGRKIGSPMTDFGIELLEKAESLERDFVGSYYSKLRDGRLLKSVTILIRNIKGKPIGVLCINIDLSAPLSEFTREFSPNSRRPKHIIEHFPSTLEELVSEMLEEVMTRVSGQIETSPIEKNKTIVKELYKRGVFKVTGVIDIVARKLGVSRYTVYNYIREAKV